MTNFIGHITKTQIIKSPDFDRQVINEFNDDFNNFKVVNISKTKSSYTYFLPKPELHILNKQKAPIICMLDSKEKELYVFNSSMLFQRMLQKEEPLKFPDGFYDRVKSMDYTVKLDISMLYNLETNNMTAITAYSIPILILAKNNLSPKQQLCYIKEQCLKVLSISEQIQLLKEIYFILRTAATNPPATNHMATQRLIIDNPWIIYQLNYLSLNLPDSKRSYLMLEPQYLMTLGDAVYFSSCNNFHFNTYIISFIEFLYHKYHDLHFK